MSFRPQRQEEEITKTNFAMKEPVQEDYTDAA
jgi:hypothetical protein